MKKINDLQSYLTRLRGLMLTLIILCSIGSGNAWGNILFHETFGNNTGSARTWDDKYSVKSGVEAVYSGITKYTVSNCKQGKNTTGSTQSGLIQTTMNEDAYIIIGPLSVASYSSLGVTYQWNAASIKGTYTTTLYYATSSEGSYTEVTGTGTGSTTFVERSYSLPVGAQVSTLYLKIVWNTSNTQAIIDEVELTGTAAASCTSNPIVSAGSNSLVTSITATVSCTGGITSLGSDGCSITDYGFVIGTSANPEIGGSGVTKHQVGTTYTSTGVPFSKDLTGLTASTTYYVRPYATNGKGTAYGTQTSFTTSALPKYTVTLKDDNSTRTQTSAGAEVTLPARAGCAGYTFAGWTKSWEAPQESWTTTAPIIIQAGNYTPAANENLYPVYTKTEGGGEPVETKTQEFQYDTWTKGGSSTDKSTYRLLHNGGYVESASDVDFSKLSKVIVYGGTFGGSSYNGISIKKADSTVWKNATVSGNSQTGTNTITGGASLTGSSKLRVYSTEGTASSSGVRISKVEVYTMEGGTTTYYISEANCCSLQAATSVRVTSVAATSVTLGWTAPSPTTGITKLQVVDGNGTVKVDDLEANATSATVTGLTECESYTFHVVSVGASCNVSSASVPAQPYSGAKTVTYNYHEGTGSPASFTTDCSHTSTTLPTPTRANYRFDGWYTSASGGTRKGGGGDNYTPDATIELHAQWTRVYTVSYDYAGGSGSCVAGGPYAAGATVTTCAAATKAGSTLTGWRRSDNGATVTPGNTFTMPAANVTLTAQWTDREYTLTQDVDSHTTKGHTGTVITSGMTSPSGLDLTYSISDNGYALPKAVTISGGGQTWTLGTNYTWVLSADKHSATLHIGADLTISDNVTITVTEQARYTVVWDEHGNTTTNYYAADDNNVAMKGGIADCGEKKFYGWTEDAGFVSNQTTPPTMASSGAISSNKRYYAIYADAAVPANPGYTRITSGNDIESGIYMIASPSQSLAYAGQNSTNSFASVVKNISFFDDAKTRIASLPSGAVNLTLTKIGANEFTLKETTGATPTEKYLKGNSSNEIVYVAASPSPSLDNNYYWQLADFTKDEVTTSGQINNVSQTGRFFRYNSTGNGRIAAYQTSTNTSEVYLYKLETTSYSNFAKTCTLYDIEITTPSGGTVTTTPAAGTGVAGEGQTVTVNVTPNSCKYLSALKYNDGNDHAISIASTPYTFTMPASAVTVTATFADKSVSSIAVNTSTHRTLMQNTSFVGEQIRVTYNNGETEYLAWDDGSLTFSGYTMSRLGSQTVNVAYSGSCGNANTSYEIEITDGIPVTYNDGNVTFVRKYQVGDIVGVDTITGKIGCNGYTFVGWSETEISSTDDEYVPVHNFTATTKTLYAVYSLQKKTNWVSIHDEAAAKSGARYAIVADYSSKYYELTPTTKNTNYLDGTDVTSNISTWRFPDTYYDYFVRSAAPPAANQWEFIKYGTKFYIYNRNQSKYLQTTSDGYLKISTAVLDSFAVNDGGTDCAKTVTSAVTSKNVRWYNSDKNWTSYASGTVLLLTKDSLFTTNPPCSPRSVTFHGNGGMVTAYGGGSSGGNLVVTEATRDAGIYLPTASIDAEDCEGNAWNFFGWIDHPVDVTRVPILTTDMLNDGYNPLDPNPHYDIVTDNDEFWAVYTNTGAPETKYGTISFTMSDFPKQYNNTEETCTKIVELDNYDFAYYYVGHASELGIQINQDPAGYLKNTTSLGKINKISFSSFGAGTIDNVRVYVGNTADAINTLLPNSCLQTVDGVSSYYPNGNYQFFKIQYTAYVAIGTISVDFGQGTTVYATTPVCSTISLSGDVYVTSRNGVGIMAATPLSVEAHQLAANADVVITSNSTDVYFSKDRNANFVKAAANQPKNSVTVTANASGELDATPIYVHYKPSSTGTGAASDVKVYANLSPANPNIKGEHTIHVRNLPEKFVIAAKVGGAYYALPADMNTATNPSGVVIEVDEMNMTAVAPNTCSYTIWPVKTTNTIYDRYALQDGNAYGERVRFASVNNSNKALWANDAASGTTIKNWASISNLSDGSTGDTGEGTNSAYEWKITTTVVDGNWQYTLQTDQTINRKYLRYWSAASGGPKWGTYASGEQNLYFLPVTEVEPFEMQVVEWYPTKVLVNTTSDLTGNTLTVRVNGSVDGDAAVTNKGSNLYEISNLDLAGNPTKLLRVDCGTGPITSCTKAIPVIISRSTQNVTDAPFTTLTEEVYNKADLVVRDNAVLTLNGTIAQNTFSSVTIYPTAKISVPSDKKLTANSLTFFGGIDDIYNGSTYTVNKYGVPELSLKGKVGKALSTINYDMRVDLSQMYALALPYDVDIAAITYWDGTAMTPGTDLYISAYDGQARVNRESRTWIYETDFAEKLGAAKLKAGVGYTISAEPQSGFGDAYSIIRMPMQAGLTADATEVAKTVAVVAYANNQGATVTDNHKGWNFVGNPYMTSISGSTAGGASDAKLVVGYLVPNTNVDPWDGSYMWRDDSYRYVTIPSDNGSENWQSKWTDVTLKPFKNFFIQVATSGDLSFALASRANAPARYMQAQDHEVEFEVLLSSAMSHDHTGLLLADKYTPAYEINADLEKMENPMSVYTLSSGYKLAYNALSPNDAKQPIPIGYIADNAGIYTFELDENSNVDEVEHVWLTDYELNRVTDLMDATYEFTTVAGRNETRFALAIELKAEETIPTNINELVMDRNAEGAVKFIYNDKMYILNKGIIYDATGKRINVINK